MRYDLIKLSAGGIELEAKGENKTITWSELVCIYPSGFSSNPMDFYRIFAVEIEGGLKYSFLVTSNERKAILEEIFDYWSDQLAKNSLPNKLCFGHSKEWIQKKYKEFWRDSIGMLIIFLPLVVLFGFMGNTVTRISLIPLFLIYLLLMTKKRFLCSKYRGIKSVCINKAEITWVDEMGDSSTKSIDEVVEYSLEKLSGKLKFRDKTGMMHLQYLSYWPVLRKLLLSKLG